MAKQDPFTLVTGVGTTTAQIYGSNANLVCSGNLVIQGNTSANSNTSGTLQIAGSLYVAGNLYVQGQILGNNTLTQLGNVSGGLANVQINDLFMGLCPSTTYNSVGTIYANPTILVPNGCGSAWSTNLSVPSGNFKLLGTRDTITSGTTCPSVWLRTP